MRFLKIILFGSFCAAGAMPAGATDFCAKHDALQSILFSRFGEQQLGAGTAGQSALVELYVSKKGTFTLVSTDTKGVSCIVGAGDNWEKLDPKDMLSAM